MKHEHLKLLANLEPNNNINYIHSYLCGDELKDISKILSKNLTQTSSIITDLYLIAESEREIEERRKRGINDDTYLENANWNRSFLAPSFGIRIMFLAEP